MLKQLSPTVKPLRRICRKNRKNNVSNNNNMFIPSYLVAKKRGKIVSFLRLFLSSRPSKARLMQSGILK